MNFEEFCNPGKNYRPCSFWSWNDALDPEELRWQVREFADKGFGGYFMHSRVGLATPYLSEEWMNCIRTCLEEGRKSNVKSWLYDEDRWQSGFAGGLVPAKGEEYKKRNMRMEEVTAGEAREVLSDPSVLMVFDVHLCSPTAMQEFTQIDKYEDVKGNDTLFRFKLEIAMSGNFFNGESYVDLLNPQVTEEFLKVTHDAYAEKFSEDFGEFMPGIFTDEPTYEVRSSSLPWTGEMPEYFYKLNGYSILENLPLLFFDGKGCHKVRYDFWKTATQRFVEAFSRLYSERCTEYGLKMTGHHDGEDALPIQVRHMGAVMPHYEYMHVPGIDHLGCHIQKRLNLIKQCTSVAHQLGKRRILTEIFGGSGHSMTFEDQKWIGDFNLAFGINFFCPHLSLYTMKGNAKRDYPPTFSYHQPYWEHFKLINDYFARASYLCSLGRSQPEILILHPIGSAWATYSPAVNIQDRNTTPWQYDNALESLQNNLLALHRDFDLGDETIISHHARIKGREFLVGESRYSIVMVPPSLTWSKKTVALLKRFLKVGGNVLFIGDNPSMIDAEPAEEEWLRILTHSNAILLSADREALSDALCAITPSETSITNEEGNELEDILVHHRVDGPNHIYFLTNKSRTTKYDSIIRFSRIGKVTECDMFKGLVSTADAVTHLGRTVIRAVFHPTGSHAFIIDTSETPAPKDILAEILIQEEVKKLPKEWRYKRMHPNSLVLDTCSYSFADGEWSEDIPLWKVRLEAWREAGLEDYSGIQPWVLKIKNIRPKSFKLRIKTRFKASIKGKKVFLVIEKAPMWKLMVNSDPVSTDVREWYWDKQFGKIDISDKVKIGENLVELSCVYGFDVPIEDMYLVGDFGVQRISETQYALSKESGVLTDGDWTEQGYPFFAGTIRYETSFTLDREPKPDERVLIRIPEAKGTLFIVNVNDQKPVPICWQPLEADVTTHVHKGKNNLVIEVVSSLRNVFGPLHNKKGDSNGVGPRSFIEEKAWVEEHQIVSYGLIKGAQVVNQITIN